MEYANAYVKYLFKSFNKKTINDQHQSGTHTIYMKPNKNMHYTSNSLYHEINTDEINIDKLNELAYANLFLLNDDIKQELEAFDNLYNIAENGDIILSKL